MDNCIFCKIISGDMPCYKVWEDSKYLAFLNIFPNTDGYTVLVAKQHQPSNFAEAKEEEVLSLTKAARKVAAQLTRAYQDVERTALVVEGMGVDHLHAQLIPVHGSAGDKAKLKILHSDKFFKEYEGYLSTHVPNKMADTDYLEQQAEIIRKAA